MENKLLTPTTTNERIEILDLLRGIAILGILIMNIQGFSMPGGAYLNPTSYGDFTGINKVVWFFGHIFADLKFISLFSILFGAGVLLVTTRSESKTGKSAGFHYKRNFLLLLIGLIHGHLLWEGDILVAYAMCSFLVYLFRNKSVKTLLVIGVIMISVHTLIYMMFGISMKVWPPEAVNEIINGWSPGKKIINKEIATMTGPVSGIISHISNAATFFETGLFLMIFLWRCGGLMLVGMALFKSGVLTGKKSNAFYKRGFTISFVIGLSVIILGLHKNFEANWSHTYSMFQGSQYNYWGSLFMSFSYICAIVMFSRYKAFECLKKSLKAVGRMALTNYIAQSVICVFIFYGFGFSLYGKVERVWQIVIVAGVSVAQILWSVWWLKRFNFGPLEWLWRSLSYGKRQKFSKK